MRVISRILNTATLGDFRPDLNKASPSMVLFTFSGKNTGIHVTSTTCCKVNCQGRDNATSPIISGSVKILGENFCACVRSEKRDDKTVKIWLHKDSKLIIQIATSQKYINDLMAVHSVKQEKLEADHFLLTLLNSFAKSSGALESEVVTLVVQLKTFDSAPLFHYFASSGWLFYKQSREWVSIQSHRTEINATFASNKQRSACYKAIRSISCQIYQPLFFEEWVQLLTVFQQYRRLSFSILIKTAYYPFLLEFHVSLKETLRFRELQHFQTFQYNSDRHFAVINIFCKGVNTVVEKPATCHQSTQTSDDKLSYKGSNLGANLVPQNSTQTQLQQENDTLKLQVSNQKFIIKEMQRKFVEEKKLLQSEISSLKDALAKVYNEKRDALAELGNILVKNDSKINEAKVVKKFQEIFPGRAMNDGDISPDFSAMSIVNANVPFNHNFCADTRRESVGLRALQSNDETKNDRSQIQNNNENDVSAELIPFPVEVVERSSEDSMGNPIVLNTYKQLLLTMSYSLLLDDVWKLKNWASQKFSIQTNLTATEVISNLDGKGAISASDLGVLRVFFESIVRIDLVYLIDEFSCGEHTMLRLVMREMKARTVTRAREIKGNQAYLLPKGLTTNPPSRSSSLGENSIASKSNKRDQFIGRSQHNATLGRSRCSQKISRSVENGDDPPMRENSDVLSSRRENGRGDVNRARTRITSGIAGKRWAKQNHSAKFNDHRASINVKKQEERWLCNHYKRRCMVKFECCDKYWPCHRCHNETSTCQQKKLKSRDTTMVKCMECGKEQQFGENDQFCVTCYSKFADFYCGLCKHLTGMDDHPYHCEKCGICRIHGDRSFHCDVCGVCLDIQLRGNHKCRPDSAHDNCGICFEDAFTGCQILPCSHKVHKECATRMIENGITRCPICRESFAHKLQRRSVENKTTRR